MRKIAISAIGTLVTATIALLGVAMAFDGAPIAEANPTQYRTVSDLTTIARMSYAD